MQLSKFTDLGIRVLLLLSGTTDKTLTIADVADRLSVSKNHLTKIVHFMSKQKWVSTIRGKNGGIQLANSPESYKVGYLIRVLEESLHTSHGIVNCHTPRCVLTPACRLPFLLNAAMNQFYSHLDQYSLQDILSYPIEHIIPLKIN
ncbi:Rrf2 family transcriptional regulator [Ignatzschineria indica]|uniref:Rrf2 family transcriptional regulator n=1 Tax=Ignatzschineria indica TaxID=472583 RepID=UPI0025789404|nr:Rrf2 family transcriptional regulator [Ignatzschineria indica]MDM1546011.1 Rrf2 family transcriptional regulator [Ignatzschineria indica]